MSTKGLMACLDVLCWAHLAHTSVGLSALCTTTPASATPTVSRFIRPANGAMTATAKASIVTVDNGLNGDGGAFDPVLTRGRLPVASLAYHGVLLVGDPGDDASESGESWCRVWSIFCTSRVSFWPSLLAPSPSSPASCVVTPCPTEVLVSSGASLVVRSASVWLANAWATVGEVIVSILSVSISSPTSRKTDFRFFLRVPIIAVDAITL